MKENTDLATIDGMMNFMEGGLRDIMDAADAPDFDPSPVYFCWVTPVLPDEQPQLICIMSDQDKYDARDNVKTALRTFGKHCNIVGFLSPMWMKDETNTRRIGEGVMIKIETRTGPSRVKVFEVLRSKDTLPKLGRVVTDHFDPNPPWGDMGNLFGLAEVQDPRDLINTGERNGKAANPHKQN